MAESARLAEGDRLSVSLGRDGAIVIKPARRRHSLGELVARITPKNRHDETDWGWPRTGRALDGRRQKPPVRTAALQRRCETRR